MKIQTFSILAGSAACNARCPYCISRMTGIKQAGYREPSIHWRNFRKACRLAQVNGVSTVLITGKGEPTLFPHQVTRFLREIKPYDFPLIELQSNGITLGRKDYAAHLKSWYALGLNTLAVSVVHYDDKKNRAIFAPGGSPVSLGDLVDKLHGLGYSVRLSCILMKDFIDSPQEIKQMAAFAKANAVEQLTFRKLGLMDEAEDPAVKKWCADHALSQAQVSAVIQILESNARKLMTLPHGAVIYELDGQNVCLTDCVMIKPQSDEIRTLIFFPDGHLRYNWNYGGAIIL